jgi:23S rRNA (guanine745-N1)-methyltransferase
MDSTWLRCPNCFEHLSPVAERVYGCERGHRFDRSKHGYLTLLPPNAPHTTGDDRAMLEARAAVLDGGAFAPIAIAIAEAVKECAIASGTQQPRIADLGCGTGYYSAHISQELARLELLVGDRSPEAVRMSGRALRDATGVVLDIWRPLPIRTATADVVLNIFSPRNALEFARILRPTGHVVTVVPTTAHLSELRDDGAMLDVPGEKAGLVESQLVQVGLEMQSRSPVEYRFDASPEVQGRLVAMGPAAYHAAPQPAGDQPAGDGDARCLTVSVDVLVFAYRSTRP